MASYSHGQVVGAIWRVVSTKEAEPPAAFLARVRALTALGVPFSEAERSGVSGKAFDYDDERAFLLLVAVMLLDTGMKRGDVALVVAECADALREVHGRISVSPPVPRQRLAREDRPGSPSRPVLASIGNEPPAGLADPFRHQFADTSVFMSLRSVEIVEALDRPPGEEGRSVVMRPTFHFGLANLMEEFDWLSSSVGDKTRIVIEIATPAIQLRDILQGSERPKRGRRPLQ